MQWLNDVWLFFTVPALVIIYSLMFGRGRLPKNYKVVRESNTLGEEKYEVWFDYPGLSSYTWRCEAEFSTLEEANNFILKQSRQREIVTQGSFQDNK